MRPRSFAAAACLLGLLGTAAPAAAASTVYVTGRVVDGSGRAVRGALVSFELRPDRSLYNQHDCPVRPWEIQCKLHKVTGRTDSGGRYRLPVRLSSYLATIRDHHLVVTDAPSRAYATPARTETSVYFARVALKMPDLPLWRGRVSIDPTADGRRTLHADQPTERFGTPYSTGPVVTLLQNGAPVWTFTAVTEDRDVDARVVEAGTNAVEARDVRILARRPVTFHTPRYAVTGGVRPASRGAKCSTYAPGDALVPLGGCKYTDGRLAAPIDPSHLRAGNKACDVASECSYPRRVVVDLGEPHLTGAVVVRGCTKPVNPEVSLEGTAFAPYPTHDFGDGLPVGPPLPARYVRVDLSKCTFRATEVSVFAAL